MVDVSLPLEEVVSREIIRKLRLVRELNQNQRERECVCLQCACVCGGGHCFLRPLPTCCLVIPRPSPPTPHQTPNYRPSTIDRQATEAESKDDREIVCEEVFCDVTGRLDAAARARLGVGGPGGDHTCFYQVLAPYYMQDTNAAEALLHFCKRLWGQSIVGAIFALLLHRWLLLRPEAGGAEQRQKHVHVLMLGEGWRGLVMMG